MAAFGLTPIVSNLARFLELLDIPTTREVHAEPTPLLGGMAIYTAFGVSILERAGNR